MTERGDTAYDRRTVHVLYMDVVRSGELYVEDMSDVTAMMRSIVDKSLNSVLPDWRNEVVVQPSGDGVGLVFSDDPTVPAQVAVLIASEWPPGWNPLRIGINTGPISFDHDVLTGTKTCQGDGIVRAQRVMATYDDGRIMMTREYVDQISHLRGWRDQVSFVGIRPGKRHEPALSVYELLRAGGPPPLTQDVDPKDARIGSLESEVEQLKAQRALLLQAIESSLESSSVVEAILSRTRQRRLTGRQQIGDEIGEIMKPFVARRDTLLNGKGMPFAHNFIVYLYNTETARLEIVWRDHDPRIVPQNRTWKRGQGLVGDAFQKNAGTIISRVGQHSDLALFGASEGTNDSLYRSMAIEVLHAGNPPVGVVVVSSDREGQLDEAHDLVMELIAQCLGYYLTSRPGLRIIAQIPR